MRAPIYRRTTKRTATQSRRYPAPPPKQSGGNMHQPLDGMTATGYSSCRIALLADLAAMLEFFHRITGLIVNGSS